MANLPFSDMTPEDFERLLLRIAREVDGLREVHLYGTRGQADFGLDVVGRAGNGEWHGWQAKRYEKFHPHHLTQAVEDHVAKDGDFGRVSRLTVCVATPIKAGAVDRLKELITEHPDIELRLYDREKLSHLLRGRRDIVAEFFGDTAAERFCYARAAGPSVINESSADKASLADSVRRTPERVSGAHAYIASAKQHIDKAQPSKAVEAFQAAEQLLIEAGFPAHAALLNVDRADAIAATGALAEAAQLMSNEFWRSMTYGLGAQSTICLRSLQKFKECAQELDPASTERAVVDQLCACAETATAAQSDPLGSKHFADELLSGPVLCPEERGQTLAFLAETALIDIDTEWIAAHATTFGTVAADLADSDELTSVRLRIAVAESTDDWMDLLEDARTRQFSRIHCGLVLARYGRDAARRERFDEADLMINEAIELACLDGFNADASRWVIALRAVRQRNPATMFKDSGEHRLSAAVMSHSGHPSLLGSTNGALRRGVEALHDARLESAAIDLRNEVRFCSASAQYADEIDARRRLAQVYAATKREWSRAARQAISVADPKLVETISQAAGEALTDVTELACRGPYWERACAMLFSSEQADLLPQASVDALIGSAFAVFEAADNGTLIDSMWNVTPQLRSATYRLLGRLATRMNAVEAANLLKRFAPSADGLERNTDADRCRSLVGIAHAHSSLRNQALDQLLSLAKANSHGWTREAEKLFLSHGSHLVPDLIALADGGSRIAAKLLVDMQATPDAGQLQRAREAVARLKEPLVLEEDAVSVGTGAVQNSLLASILPSEDLVEPMTKLMEEAGGQENGYNRAERISAATIIASGIDDAAAATPFGIAMEHAKAEPTPSLQDAMLAATSHPLGGIHFSDTRTDLRPNWLHLASRLARDNNARGLVHKQALYLLQANRARSTSYLAAVLQILPKEQLSKDAVFLATHPEWTIRAVAALAWAADSTTEFADLGVLLAIDLDPRVRRTLADAIGSLQEARFDEAKVKLAQDARFSVRSKIKSD